MKTGSCIGFFALTLGAALVAPLAASAAVPAVTVPADLSTPAAHAASLTVAAVPMSITPASQRLVHEHLRRHVHHRRHAVVASYRVRRSSGTPAPAPAHRSPQQPAVPSHHQLRAGNPHPRSSTRYTFAAVTVTPLQLMSLGSAPSTDFVAMHRVDLWRSEGRGPPRAGPDDALPTRSFLRRPSEIPPGAPADLRNFPQLQRLHGQQQLHDLDFAAPGIPPAGPGAPSPAAAAAGFPVAPSPAAYFATGAVLKLPVFDDAHPALQGCQLRCPFEGTAAAWIMPSDGGCT